jgi:hypothetical protein
LQSLNSDLVKLERAAKDIGDDLNALAQALLEYVMSIARSFPPDKLSEVMPGLGNSPYTVVHHLLGSARYWIGEVVGGQETAVFARMNSWRTEPSKTSSFVPQTRSSGCHTLSRTWTRAPCNHKQLICLEACFPGVSYRPKVARMFGFWRMIWRTLAITLGSCV